MELEFTFLRGFRDAIAAHYEGRVMEHHGIFDIAVADISREISTQCFGPFGRRNRHGGYALRADGAWTWDVWRLEKR